MSYSQLAHLELMNAINSINSESELNEFRNMLARYLAMRRIVLDTNCLLQDAKYIVTNDKHFDVLKNIPWSKLSVINIKEFIAQIANS